jgi:hypothetical protein
LTNHILINHTSVLKNEREKDEEERRRRRRKEKQRRQNKKIRYFLLYPLSFACFSPISFIIFFSVLPTIYKREQDREKLRKKFFIFFPVVAPWVGVAQAQSLAGLTPGPTLVMWLKA